MDEIDLRNEIIRLKKRMTLYREENQLLKVKVRKLTSQIVKRDKDIETLLNPKQISNFRKVFSERSVSIISEMREKNEFLEKQLNEKNAVIRNLQASLKIAKCYATNDVSFKRNRTKSSKMADLRNEKLKLILNLKDEHFSKGQSSCGTPEDPQTLIELSESNSGKEQFKVEQINRIKNCSPESDLDRTELFYSRNGKHEEIQYLQDHFLDLLTEVDVLKTTISKLENEQYNTKHVLERKDNNIEKLAEEIEILKLSKAPKVVSVRSLNSASSLRCSKKEKQDLIKRIYSATSPKQSKKEKYNMPKIIIIKEIPTKIRDNNTETENKEILTEDMDISKVEVQDTDIEAETY